jgi:hypothetical protein
VALLAVCACADHDRTGPEATAREPAALAESSPGSVERAAGAGATGEELRPLLALAARPGRLAEADRIALEQAMARLVVPAATAACGQCETTIAYVDESGGGDYLQCDVDGASGTRWAEIQLFHRPDLAVDAAKSWGRSTLAGHPASALPGEHLFVWPGRFEIRAFARDASSRGAEPLERLVEGLPLDALSRL